MSNDMELGLVLKTRDDGTVQALSATGKEIKAVENATKSATKQTGLWANKMSVMDTYTATYLALNFGKKLLTEAGIIGKTADKLGVATKALQQYHYAAKLSGVTTQTFDVALQNFTRRTKEAAKGTGEAKGALKELGISLTDNNGKLRSVDDLLDDVADAMSGVSNQSDKVRLSQKLFASEGTAMINMLSKGSNGLQAMKDEAERLGVVLDDQTVRAAENASDRLETLGTVLKTKLTTGLVGVLDFFSPLIAGFTEIAGSTTAWIAGIGLLATAITGKLVPAFVALARANPFLTAVGLGITGIVALVNHFTEPVDQIEAMEKKLKRMKERLVKGSKGPYIAPTANSGGMLIDNLNGGKKLTPTEQKVLKEKIEALEKQIAEARKVKSASNGQSGGNAGTGGTGGGGAQKSAWQIAEEERLKQIKQHWDEQHASVRGATAAFDDWATKTGDGLKMWTEAASNAMQGFEDALVKATLTGKLSFKDMAQSIIADIVRIQIRQNITGPMAKDFGSWMRGAFGKGSSPTPRPGDVLAADGGYIPMLAGSARSDSQFVGVSGSEYIVNARATAAYLPVLEQINNGTFKKYANGGWVGGSGQTLGKTSAPTVNFNVKDNTGGAVQIQQQVVRNNEDGDVDIEAVMDMVDNSMAERLMEGRGVFADALGQMGGLQWNKGG